MEWGSGEWDNEPDEFEFIYKEVKCWGYRHSIGIWLAYIDLPLPEGEVPDNEYSDEDDFGDVEFNNIYESIIPTIEVHGGITYSKYVDKYPGPNVLRIGFDCCHIGDLIPSVYFVVKDQGFNVNCKMCKLWGNPVYRNIEFVKDECKKIVDQIKKDKE